MKILYVVKTNKGASWALEQALGLKELGAEIVAVLPCGSGGTAEEYRRCGIKVVAADLSLPVKRPWLLPRRIRLAREIVAAEKPDIIHCHFVTNIMLIRLALGNSGPARVFQVPGPLHLEHFPFRAAELLLAGRRDYWAPSCRYSLGLYLRAGVPRERLFLCRYGGYGDRTALYGPPSGILRGQLNIPEGCPLVGMVSHIYRPKRYLFQFRGIKGHEDFIRAIAILKKTLPDIRGVIIGGAWNGAERYVRRLEGMARRLCVGSVSFAGHRDDLTAIYRELDAAVCPSLSENLGAAAESLAAGVPTVASNTGGFTDIVSHGVTGLLARPKSPGSLADCIGTILSDRAGAADMAEKGRELVERLLSLERCCGRVYGMYRSICGGEEFSPLVSIIIPVYNGGEYLSQAIDSALSQTYRNIEVLVVNDGSDDGGETRRTALSYGERIRYFEKENGGVSSALNLGIRNMRGERFSWLSHDDLYHPDKIRRQTDFLRALSYSLEKDELENTVLHGHTLFIDEKGRTICRMASYIENDSRSLVLKGIRRNRFSGCSFLIHRSRFERFGMFDEGIRTVSDYDMWYRLLFGGCSFVCVPEYHVKNRMHRRQVTHTQGSLAKREMEDFCMRVAARACEDGLLRSPRDFLRLGGYMAAKGLMSCARYALDKAKELDCSPSAGLKCAAVYAASVLVFNIRRLFKKVLYKLLLR